MTTTSTGTSQNRQNLLFFVPDELNLDLNKTIILPPEVATLQDTLQSKPAEEVKPKFIIGEGNSDTFETENFSEVSLERDSSADEPILHLDNNNSVSDFYGNLQPTLNLTDNSTVTTDINLNPITAAISALPTAASTVFSTFSNIIKGSSAEIAPPPPAPVQQDQIQEDFNPYSQQFIPNYNLPEPSDPGPPPVVGFFSPNDETLIKKQEINNPDNTFRLRGTKKKHYAHIPGLSTNTGPGIKPTIPDPLTQPVGNFNFDQPPQSTYGFEPPQQKPSEPTLKPNKFSLSSLIPNQILEKIPVPSFAKDNDKSSTQNFFSEPQVTTSAGYFNNFQQETLNPPSNEFLNPVSVPSSNFGPPTVEIQTFAFPTSQEVKPIVDLPPPPVDFKVNPTPPPAAVENPPNFFNVPPVGVPEPINQVALPPPPKTSDTGLRNPYSLARGARSYKNPSLIQTSKINSGVPAPLISTVDQAKTSIFNPTASEAVQTNFFENKATVEPVKTISPAPFAVQPPPTIQSAFAPPVGIPSVVQQQSFESIQATLPPAELNQTPSTVQPPPVALFNPIHSTPELIRPPSAVQTPFLVQPPPVGLFNPVSSTPDLIKPPSIVPTPVEPIKSFSPAPPTVQSTFSVQAPTTVQPSPFSVFPPAASQTPPTVQAPPTVDFFNSYQAKPAVNQSPFIEPPTSTPLVSNPSPALIDPTASFNSSATSDSALNFFNISSDNTTSNFANYFAGPVETNFKPIATPPPVTDQILLPQGKPIETVEEKPAEVKSIFPSREKLLELLENPGDTDIDIMAALENLEASVTSPNKTYRQVYQHWFYEASPNHWTPFSMTDSLAIDESFTSKDPASNIVPTDGGRFDVNITERKKYPVYWKGESMKIKRCSWFYQSTELVYVPYDEETAERLEREYETAMRENDWHRKIELPSGDLVVFHEPSVIVHFYKSEVSMLYATSSSAINRPRVVKRGVDSFNIEDGESDMVDHLIFMVHGIGKVCDLQFRTVEQVVDTFRSQASVLIQSHYKSSYEHGKVGRIEILPISWYSILHSEENMIDSKLKSITLDSIPKLRSFTNETLLDVLFYSSPRYCQGIIDHVANTINKVYTQFIARNSNFSGNVSLCGHSLGSLILFDILYHQKPSSPDSKNPESESPEAEACSGTGAPLVNYPQLLFEPKNYFALGSPVGMFVTIRGIDHLGLDFKLPTCDGFYNIFHPYDPVAYRIEALINPELSSVSPVLLAHHKGRKRMHLEFKETISKVSNDIKQKVMDVFKNTVDTFQSLTSFGKGLNYKAIESEVDKVLESQLEMETGISTAVSSPERNAGPSNLNLGLINRGNRVDYMLQEAPFEFFNEYIFALTSHVGYWDSNDTILFMMQEIYLQQNIAADKSISQIPQNMKIERKSNAGDEEYDENLN